MKRIIPITLFLLVIWLFNQAHASPATEITIERFLYDGYEPSNEGDEYVKLCNISGSSVDLSNGGTNPWRVGDDESSTGGLEGMYNFPTIAAATVASGNCIIIARAADAFIAQWNMVPDFEFAAGTDNVSVPNMIAVDGGPFYLNNDGDNITLWKYNGAAYDLHDSVAYGTTEINYTDVGLPSTASDQINCGANTNCALTRNSVSTDTDNMASDFNNTANPTAVALQSLTTTTANNNIAIILVSLLLITLLSLFVLRRRHA